SRSTPSLRNASAGEVPARRRAHGTSRCMIAASERLVQISADLMATLTSGFGGMMEKPMKYDLVPCDGTSGARGAGAHAISIAVTTVAGVRADLIINEYVFRQWSGMTKGSVCPIVPLLVGRHWAKYGLASQESRRGAYNTTASGPA